MCGDTWGRGSWVISIVTKRWSHVYTEEPEALLAGMWPRGGGGGRGAARPYVPGRVGFDLRPAMAVTDTS